MSDVLERVRALITKAEHASTPLPEAEACRKMADTLMFKYAIDAATLDAGRPAEQRQTPVKRVVDLAEFENPINYHFASLGKTVADHTRCKVVWIRAGWPGNRDRMHVFGFESDVAYFDILYTTLFLHMSGIFFPKPNDSLSLEENLLELRKLGMNWLQMAEVYGWSKTMTWEGQHLKVDGKPMYSNKHTGERKTSYQVGGYYKRVYHSACQKKGIKPDIIQSTVSSSFEYRKNAASGYVSEVNSRLRAARSERGAGTEMVLADRMDEIEAMLAEAHPNMKNIQQNTKFNPDAYARGIAHGRTADISGSSRMAGRTGGELA